MDTSVDLATDCRIAYVTIKRACHHDTAIANNVGKGDINYRVVNFKSFIPTHS